MVFHYWAVFFFKYNFDARCIIVGCVLLEGVLACLDGYMNIALEQTEEYANGQLRNKYGDTFIRGNNGKYTADKIEINMTRLSRIFTLAISKRYGKGILTFFSNLHFSIDLIRYTKSFDSFIS